MKTYLNKDTGLWQSNKPVSYWSGLVDVAGNKIFTTDTFFILNAVGHKQPVELVCTDYISWQANTYYYQKVFKLFKLFT